MGKSFVECLIADFKAAGHECCSLYEPPTICVEVDGEYIVYLTDGQFLVEGANGKLFGAVPHQSDELESSMSKQTTEAVLKLIK